MIVSSTKTIGRNDPCHCGSGKKYKKCCLEKEEKEELAQIAAEKSQIQSSAIERWEEGSLQIVDEFADFEEFDNEEEDSYEMLLDGEVDNEYPEISDEEKKLVDLWWDEYNEIENPDDIRNHIEDFMNTHPNLVENLGLEHEVLFELGGNYRKVDRLDEYIELLFKLRQKFPPAYIRGAAYFDSDIIAWLISKGRGNEIEQYLNYLAGKLIEFPDEIRSIIRLCSATDNIKFITEFIKKVSDNSFDDVDGFLDYDDIAFALIFNSISKYLQPDFSENDIEQIRKDMEANCPEHLSLHSDFHGFWKRRLENIFRPFQAWPEKIYPKKGQMTDIYYDISNNFMRYLHENMGLSWEAAQYYAGLIQDFHVEVLNNHKGKRRKLFHFSYEEIKTLVISLSEDLVFIDPIKLFSLLNAIYYFASYLALCGNIDEDEKMSIQQACERIFHECYTNLKVYSTETFCFSHFPLWRMRAD